LKLIDALNLKFPKAISLVGAGGKTLFIFTLAKEAAGLGKSILITTTTAMFNPEYFDTGRPTSSQAFDHLFIGPAQNLPHLAADPGTIIVAAPALKAQGSKLAGYSPQDLTPLLTSSQFDLVLIEADGARMRPIKAPANHEPVIPDQTGMVAGCIGLDCLGTPLDDSHVHRPKILADLSGQKMKEPVTARTLTCLTTSDRGIFKSVGPDMKKILLLNKADTPGLIKEGKSLGRDIMSRNQTDLCLVTSFLNKENPVRHTIRRGPF